MASTTRSGAVYGIGVYGAVRYGETSVTHVPDGVFATCNSDSGVIIIGDAVSVVVGVSTTAAVGGVGVVGVAVTSVVGVEATAVLGEVSQRTVNRVPVDGIEAVGAVGDIVVVADANTVVFGSTAFGFVGGVTIRAASSVTIVGVVAVANVGDNVTFKLDCKFDIAGVVGATTVDFLVVATTSFDYEAVRDLYERYRTVFVERGTTGAERTAIIEAVPRNVYIESRPIREIAVN